MWECITSHNNVTTGMYVGLIIFGFILDILIFKQDMIFDKNSMFTKCWENVTNRCFYNCDTGNCKKYTSFRGTTYFMDQEANKSCMFTGWELTHLLFHVFLGYFYNIYVSLGISVGYEIFEYVKYDCHSALDLVINFIGFMIGASLRCCGT